MHKMRFPMYLPYQHDIADSGGGAACSWVLWGLVETLIDYAVYSWVKRRSIQVNKFRPTSFTVYVLNNWLKLSQTVYSLFLADSTVRSTFVMKKDWLMIGWLSPPMRKIIHAQALQLSSLTSKLFQGPYTFLHPYCKTNKISGRYLSVPSYSTRENWKVNCYLTL